MAGQRSDLGSPVLVASPGVTNRVPLQIGIEYAVTSAVPFSVGLPMSGFAELLRDEPTSKTVKWPLEFSFTEESCRSNIRTYSVSVGPYNPGGYFSWEGPDASHGRASLMSAGRSSPECGCVSFANGVWTFCCSGSCTCNGTCEASGSYYVAGSIFGVTGGVCRCGFEDPEDDEPPTPPEDNPSGVFVSVSFTKSAVIFEDAYENGPGVRVPRKSTRVRLDLSASGGPNGGSLSFEGANLEKLVTSGGSAVSLSSGRQLLPYEDYHLSLVCEGYSQSEGVGDISVWGYISDAETAQASSDSASLTAVRLEVLPLVLYPAAYPHRHMFGVCERVQMFSFPSSLTGHSWESSGNVLDGALENNIQYYTYLYQEGGCDMTFSYGDASYTVHTTCHAPTDIVCRQKPALISGGVPSGTAGGVGMRMDLTVLPDSVSFSGIRVMERISNDGVATGYFLQDRFSSWRNHNSVHGAGRLISVGAENNLGDEAVMSGSCPEDELFGGWAGGGDITWTIPCAWREGSGLSFTAPLTNYTTKEQIFTIDSAGTVEVRKFNCRAVRTAFGYAETFLGQ